VSNYPNWFKQICEETGDDFVVKYAWAEEYVSPVDGKNTGEWCEKFGVERCNTMERYLEYAAYYRKNGLVCYNHPRWSMSGYGDYAFIDGLWGIEVYNSGGCYGRHIESVTPFEYLLMQNKNVYPIACDDMHDWHEAFLGFTMVKSPSLKYDDIFEALKKGIFTLLKDRLSIV
jgi:hypothetical protein